jgi:hypothetical protein
VSGKNAIVAIGRRSESDGNKSFFRVRTVVGRKSKNPKSFIMVGLFEQHAERTSVGSFIVSQPLKTPGFSWRLISIVAMQKALEQIAY